MAIIFQKKTYVNIYIAATGSDTAVCYSIGAVNPDTFDLNKMLSIIRVAAPCLNSAYRIKAIKKVSGYKVR